MKRLVVGLDGSPAAGNALLWAVAHLDPDGVIEAVHAISPGAELALGLRPSERRRMVESARADLEGVWTDPARRAGAELSCHVADDSPADALIGVAADVRADAVVVGCHGSGRIPTSLLGSVARKLLHLSPAPIVVLGDDAAVTGDGPVVVGVDDDTSLAAARWAAGHAAARNRPLVVTHAAGRRSLLLPAVGPLGTRPDDSPTDVDLDRLTVELTEAHPDLDVTVSLAPGPAQLVLGDAGAGASLLVLGKARGHLLADSLIGPVIRHVLTHSTAPITVVPSDLGLL